MKYLILWVPPAERRFGSGDTLTAAQLAEFGIDAEQLVTANEAQRIDDAGNPASPRATRKKG